MIGPRGPVAVAILFVVATLGPALPALAQTTIQGVSLRDGLVRLGDPLGSAQAGALVATLADIEVSTAPLGTSTGGFTFTFDPSLRTWKRSASSFGPAFSERALTTGKGRFSAGFNYLHSNYRSLEGFDLHNGELQPALNIVGDPNRTASTSLQLNMSSDTVVAYGHVGVTDDIDIGIAVPWVRVNVDGVGRFLTASGTALQSITVKVDLPSHWTFTSRAVTRTPFAAWASPAHSSPAYGHKAVEFRPMRRPVTSSGRHPFHSLAPGTSSSKISSSTPWVSRLRPILE